jgi:hypothetical protein
MTDNRLVLRRTTGLSAGSYRQPASPRRLGQSRPEKAVGIRHPSAPWLITHWTVGRK